MSEEEDYDIWYVCKNCREAYPNKEDLAMHRKIKHPKLVPRIPNQNPSVEFQFHSEIVNNLSGVTEHEGKGGNINTTRPTDIYIRGEYKETVFEKEMPVLEMECFQNGTNVGSNDKFNFDSKSTPQLPQEIQEESEKMTELQLQGTPVQPESVEVEGVKSNTIEIKPFFHTKNKYKRQKRMQTPSSGPKTNEKVVECAICEISSRSDQMIGCNSCSVRFHVTCVSGGRERAPILIQDELFCFDCAGEKDQDEHEDSHEMNALKNIKKRGKTRSQKIIEPPEPKVPIIKKSDSDLPESTKKSSREVKKPVERQEKCVKYLFYQCNQCPKLFISKINAGKHYKHHYESEGHEQPTQTINFCTAKIFTVYESDLSCPLCEHSFDQKLNQVIHIANHFEENQVSVPERSKEKSSSVQSAQIETVQNSEKHGQSSQTYSQESGQQSWSELNESIMTNKKNQCVWCGKEFKKFRDLTEHMGIHTGEKSHHCKYCDKYFRFSSYFRIHVKRCKLQKQIHLN